MHFSQAVAAIQHLVGTIKDVQVLYSEETPLQTNLCINLKSDGLRLVFLARPAFFVPVCRKMKKVMGALHFFATRQWIWKDGNTRALWAALDDQDRALFAFDVQDVAWRPFLENYVLGTRQYVLKNSPETLPASRMKLKFFCALHYLVLSAVFAALAFLGYRLICYVN